MPVFAVPHRRRDDGAGCGRDGGDGGVESAARLVAYECEESYHHEGEAPDGGHDARAKRKPAREVDEPARHVGGNFGASGRKRPDKTQGDDDHAEGEDREQQVERTPHAFEASRAVPL